MAGKYYHPNFFDATDPTGGGDRHRKRLQLIQNCIGKGKRLLDIGCANGLFSFAFSKTHNHVMGVDYSQERIDSCKERAAEHHIQGVDFACLDVMGEEFADTLFTGWDTVTYLSMHQHVIAHHGFPKADAFLRDVSENCDEMFFDMGQKDETSLKHNAWWPMLPVVDDVRVWMREYLMRVTVYSSIRVIGTVNRMIWHLT